VVAGIVGDEEAVLAADDAVSGVSALEDVLSPPETSTEFREEGSALRLDESASLAGSVEVRGEAV
jgi:hypothetical protein